MTEKMTYLEVWATIGDMIEDDEIDQFDEIDFEKVFKRLFEDRKTIDK